MRIFKKGELITYHSEVITHLIMLTKGRVKTEIISNSGIALPVDEIEAPYPLSSSFLFADNNRIPVDITAVTECEVIFIRKEAIEKQLMACPGFLRGFLTFNANHTQSISERLKIFAQRGIKSKVVYYILSREVDGVFDLNKSVSSLADYFGVDRSSLSRVISELVREQIIEIECGRGRILNQKALIQYSL
ncbi:MAG: Crp/Fnr family transcriptional regulator [Bacteroidales bacterium]